MLQVIQEHRRHVTQLVIVVALRLEALQEVTELQETYRHMKVLANLMYVNL